MDDHGVFRVSGSKLVKITLTEVSACCLDIGSCLEAAILLQVGILRVGGFAWRVMAITQMAFTVSLFSGDACLHGLTGHA